MLGRYTTSPAPTAKDSMAAPALRVPGLVGL